MLWLYLTALSLASAAPAFALAVGIALGLIGCGRTPEPLTPEAARAKGDTLLREMSEHVGALQTFAYTATEVAAQVSNGTPSERRTTRRVIIRRPNALTFTSTGDTRDGAFWYDGDSVTMMSNTDRVWARGPMPPTLDEALDYVSAEYAIQLPSADLLYSSPYDALMTPETTGGWRDVQTVDTRQCDHLVYQDKSVDWEIWINVNGRLPCQIRIKYKNEAGQQATTVTFTDLEISPKVTDDTFTPKVPDDYQRIKIMRHGSVADPSTETAARQ
jgi:hypothetical protein